MQYKVKINTGWDAYTFYYEKESLARYVADMARNDKRPVSIFRKSETGWEEMI